MTAKLGEEARGHVRAVIDQAKLARDCGQWAKISARWAIDHAKKARALGWSPEVSP